MHLDPRLADGRSPARALAAVRTVVGEWRFDKAADLQDETIPWSVRNGLLTPARGGEAGINVRLADFNEATGLTMASLVYRGDLYAADVNAIEVEARLPKDGAGLLKWVPRNPRESDRPADFRLEAPFVGSEEWQTITYPLDTTAAWRGRLVSMELSPAGLASASFEIRAVRMVRAVLPAMRRQKYGRIVNVAGNTGRQPHPRLLPGSTTNAALLSFTKGLSEEIMKYGIFINALQPGPTQTEHWGKLMTNLSRGTGFTPKAFEKEFMKEIPMRRVAAAIEMARPVIFMASDLASYMTGRSIIVDGGWTKDLA